MAKKARNDIYLFFSSNKHEIGIEHCFWDSIVIIYLLEIINKKTFLVEEWCQSKFEYGDTSKLHFLKYIEMIIKYKYYKEFLRRITYHYIWIFISVPRLIILDSSSGTIFIENFSLPWSVDVKSLIQETQHKPINHYCAKMRRRYIAKTS